jgi:hypothetical protein
MEIQSKNYVSHLILQAENFQTYGSFHRNQM